MTPSAALVLERFARIAPGEPVPSPCNSVCRMSADTGWCEGCFRTLDEIAAWSRLGDDDKRAVWRVLAQRARA